MSGSVTSERMRLVFDRFLGAEDQSVDVRNADGAAQRPLVAVWPEQQLSHCLVDLDVAGEPADRVERRGERHDAVDGDAAMGGAQADQAAEARRGADRAAGVGAEAMSARPPATAAAEPEEDPPVTRPGAAGLTG